MSDKFNLEFQGEDAPLQAKIVQWLEDYAQQKAPGQLPLSLDGLPPFTREALSFLSSYPFGKVLRYQDLAKATGSPRAARAAGTACGRNPLPLFIPCHRVIASDGSAGGFSLDPAIKEWLLQHELAG